MTANDLIKRTLRTIGVVAAGSPMDAQQAADGLEVLNGMLKAFQAQRLTLYVTPAYTYPLVAGQQDYTLGPGGDFDQTRPMTVEGVSIISYQNPAQPLEIVIDPIFDRQQWQAIPTKAVQSALPIYCYVETSFPLMTLKFFPVPSGQQTLSARLYIPTPLTAFADLTTDYTFPPPYEEALVYQLAKRLAIEYGRQMTADLTQMVNESIMVMKRSNITLIDLELDPALLWRRRYFNWLSGAMQ